MTVLSSPPSTEPRAAASTRLHASVTKLFPTSFSNTDVELAFRRQYARTGHRQSVIGLSIGLVLALVAIALSIILDYRTHDPQIELILLLLRSSIAIILAIGIIKLPNREQAEATDYFRWVILPAIFATLALIFNYWAAALHSQTPPPAARIFLVSALALWLFCAFARPSSRLATFVAVISSIGAIIAGYISEGSMMLDSVAYLLIANFSALSVTTQSEKRARALYQRTLELEESQRQLSAKSDRAIRSRDFKSRVLTTVSHDLRQPLLGANLILSKELTHADGPDPTKLHIVSDALRQIEGGLEEILQAAAVDEIDPENSLESVNLAVIVTQALSEAEPIARHLGIEVHWRNHLPVDVHVLSSPGVIKTALSNLLGNALKFQHEAPNPWVLVRCFAPRSPENSVCLEVIDNGPGIAPESAAKIFATGYRLRRDSHLPGFGIGLASIAEQVRELPHHEAILVPRYRRGARFRLTFPVASTSGTG